MNTKLEFHKSNGGDPRAGILGVEEAKGFIAGGFAAADLHVHTHHSYDVIPTGLVDPLTLYRKARRLGMTYVAFTDHDTMDAYDQIGWTREGLVPADLTLVRLKEETAVRIRHLFDKAGWLYPKESFAMDTGNAILDGIIERLAQAPADAPGIGAKILEKIFEFVSRSGIPGSLYVRNQRNLADRIGELLESTETAA